MGFTAGDEGPGGQLSCRTDAHLLYIDGHDFQRTWESYALTVAAGQKSDTYIQTFMASIDLFRTWAWSDVLDFAGEVEGMQVGFTPPNSQRVNSDNPGLFKQLLNPLPPPHTPQRHRTPSPTP